MIPIRIAAIAFSAALAACSSMSASAPGESARDRVWAAELAFARTMADRNLGRFGEFVAEEAVFFAGTTALRGRTSSTPMTSSPSSRVKVVAPAEAGWCS